jgi:hypothetical protein
VGFDLRCDLGDQRGGSGFCAGGHRELGRVEVLVEDGW